MRFVSIPCVDNDGTVGSGPPIQELSLPQSRIEVVSYYPPGGYRRKPIVQVMYGGRERVWTSLSFDETVERFGLIEIPSCNETRSAVNPSAVESIINRSKGDVEVLGQPSGVFIYMRACYVESALPYKETVALFKDTTC